MKKFVFPSGLSVFCVSDGDLDAAHREIFVEKIYDRGGIVIRDGDCIFDVGANIGLFSIWVSQVCHQPKIFAFEPIPETFAALTKNIAAHSIAAKTYAIGLSRNPGEAEFTHYFRLAMGSTMYPKSADDIAQFKAELLVTYERIFAKEQVFVLRLCPKFLRIWLIGALISHATKSRRIKCKLDTVSGVIEREQIEGIDLLKIDAEGSELDILAGIEEQDWQKIRQLIVEVHERDDIAKVDSLLHEKGYRTVVDNNPVTDIEALQAYMIYARQ